MPDSRASTGQLESLVFSNSHTPDRCSGRGLVAGSGSEVLLHEDRCLGLADPTTGHTLYEAFDVLGFGVEPPRVQTKEGQQHHESGALVSVYEGVVSDDVEEVGRGHLLETFVEESCLEGGRGNSSR